MQKPSKNSFKITQNIPKCPLVHIIWKPKFSFKKGIILFFDNIIVFLIKINQLFNPYSILYFFYVGPLLGNLFYVFAQYHYSAIFQNNLIPFIHLVLVQVKSSFFTIHYAFAFFVAFLWEYYCRNWFAEKELAGFEPQNSWSPWEHSIH